MKIGTNDSVMIRRQKKSAGPDLHARRSRSVPALAGVGLAPRCSSLPRLDVLVAFSIMTIAASTIAPMAMAMPPSDMMFALMP